MSAKDAYLRRMQEDAEERGTYARPAGPGSRIAERYRGTPSDRLRATRPNIRNPRSRAAIDIVLTERQESYQAGFDAGQVLLDVISGTLFGDIQTLHVKALDSAMRHADAKRFLEAEKAYGVANAFWDYLRERSDT